VLCFTTNIGYSVVIGEGSFAALHFWRGVWEFCSLAVAFYANVSVQMLSCNCKLQLIFLWQINTMLATQANKVQCN